jgi:CHAT domain
MNEVLTDTEIAALAAAFSAVRGEKVLWRVGFPDASIPSPLLNAGDFWAEVSRALANGVLPGGRRRIIALASQQYPASHIFAGGRLRKVLLVGASPDGSGTIRADRELRELRLAARLGHLQISAMLAAQVSDLRVILGDRPDILHLSTHGDGAFLYFESQDGEDQRIPITEVTSTLIRYINADGLKLAGLVLASCHSDSAAKAFLAVAESVIAHRGLLNDADAVVFARRLYEGLSVTPSLTAAANDAAEDLARDGVCDLRANLIAISGGD